MVTVPVRPVDSIPVELETVKTVAMWAIIVIAVLGILAAIIIRKIVGKIISLVLAAVLIFVGWQQRDRVTDYADNFRADACAKGADPKTGQVTFLGIDVDLPDDFCKRG